MGHKSLELTLISAKDLKNVNLFGKMDVYVVAFLSGDPTRTKQKTPVHQDGGTSPRWNHTMRFTVDDAAATMLVLQLKHEHTFGADKDLGEVRVPVKDLIDGFRSTKDVPPVLTYQVRRPSGKPKGELKFSYKLNDVVSGQPKAFTTPTAYPTSTSNSAYPPPPPATAYPPPVTAYPAYPPQATAYPPPPPYAPPPPYGYGSVYAYPPPYVPQQQPQRPRRNGGFGMGMGAGLLGGALGGLLIGDLVSDVYDDGYDAGAGDFDMGDF